MAKKEKHTVVLYDTTLRDGTQAEDINFSVEDKVRVARALDALGIHYIEGGYPGSNPRDIEFFKQMKKEKLKNAVLTAFGSTKRPGKKASEDAGVKELLSAGTDVVTIVAKTWKFHVTEALKISLNENLDLIHDTVSHLKNRKDKVFYDAEHFFDAYRDDPAYAMKVLKTAEDAGADCLVLCDTNGGMLPFEIERIVREVKKNVTAPLGVHCHNDADTGVANTLTAVKEGAIQVQGTMNGFGERCGNVNLCSVIPALKLKMGIDCISDANLKKLSETARFVYEIANLTHNKRQPYIGESAFAHKGGLHVSAVLKDPATYEHVKPEAVGNHRRVLVSDLAGRSNIIYKAAEYGLDIESGSPEVKRILDELKKLEHQGFLYEGAEASFELLIHEALGKRKKYFKLHGFKVTDSKKDEGEPPRAEATIKIDVKGEEEHTAAEGNGPVNALDKALRKALERFYPTLQDVKLIDFKVRVLAGKAGTSAKVRVLVESGDGKDKWGTVGVSENVIEASWQALVDSLEYKLYKDGAKRTGKKTK
ncbi:MAG: citramalate synthase [Deltaproteobacteria bacterium]|nr:citramalate synthase [Deltaproteobacteria bacterium]